MEEHELHNYLNNEESSDILYLMVKGIFFEYPNLFGIFEGLDEVLTKDLDDVNLNLLSTLQQFQHQYNKEPNTHLICDVFERAYSRDKEALEIVKDAVEYQWPFDHVLKLLNIGDAA